ncbi:MAG: DUF2878 domain-containing protein [Xanthomonadales bacterium]|nr:DUF2878 domain-containing protein [Xanthomonadales bacterium]
MMVLATTVTSRRRSRRHARVRLWGNFIGYEAVWFCAVIAAAHGLAWPGLLAFAAFAVWQLAMSKHRQVEYKLLVVALCCGLLLDGLLAASGLLGYATASPALPPGGAPLWILALWAAFALTLTQSLGYLQKHLWLAALFGALGGPLAFWCAAQGWGVVSFAAPAWHGLLVLAVGWGVAMPLLAGCARRELSKLSMQRGRQ